jgi:hypothetical protein
VHDVLERLNCDDFAPLVGERFELVPPGRDGIEIELSSATEGVPATAGDRVPFSLIFHGAPGPVVPQQICTLRHPGLDDLELFVVPIVPDRRGTRYEIVFA